jgi:hypothetical protein
MYVHVHDTGNFKQYAFILKLPHKSSPV